MTVGERGEAKRERKDEMQHKVMCYHTGYSFRAALAGGPARLRGMSLNRLYTEKPLLEIVDPREEGEAIYSLALFLL